MKCSKIVHGERKLQMKFKHVARKERQLTDISPPDEEGVLIFLETVLYLFLV